MLYFYACGFDLQNALILLYLSALICGMGSSFFMSTFLMSFSSRLSISSGMGRYLVPIHGEALHQNRLTFNQQQRRMYKNRYQRGKIHHKRVSILRILSKIQWLKFVFSFRKQSCYKCMVIYQKHSNVLQYKESKLNCILHWIHFQYIFPYSIEVFQVQ